MGNEYQVKNLKPAGVRPTELKKLGNRELKISWSDGHQSVYPFRYLRQNCQCALCVDEWSGKPILARESVSQDLEGLKVRVVGQYALGIDFSDGHSTGLYAFEHLRKICPCEACLKKQDGAREEKKYLDKEDLRSKNVD